MRTSLFILSLLLFFSASGQETLTANQWQEDLLVLQETIHNDYSFLFDKTTPEIFDEEVKELYQEIPNLEEHEVVIGFMKLVALFEYGHTGVWAYQPFEFQYLPLNLYQYSDGLYLQGVHKDYPQAVGAKLLKVNNIPVEKALEMIAPVVNAENDQYFKAYGINYLTALEVLHAQGITKELESAVELTLSKDGNVFKQVFSALPKGEGVPSHRGFTFESENWLEARNQEDTPLYMKDLDKVYFFEYLADKKAVYVRHSRIQDDPSETTEAFYKRVFDFVEENDVEKLILDVRLNGGGDNTLNKPVVQGIIETKKINQVGNLFVITGRRTFSACQNLVNELDNYTNCIFVGEGTAENLNFWGDAQRITLPNTQLPVYLSYAWWQDKSAWANAEGTVAMVPVEMSFTQYSQNEDPVLDAALDFEEDNFLRDPMAYITSLYRSGDMQRLTEELPGIVFDPKYSFVDFEAEFSRTGTRLLNLGRAEQTQAAIQIFTMVTQFFPQSPSAWKNLGVSYLKVGDQGKAVNYLNKAISMDGDGDLGRQAKEILATIK